MQHKVTVGTFAIILDEQNRVLLCHRRDYDLWNLPGGALEEGESPGDGAIREVKEETELEVRVERLVGVYSKPDKDEIVFSFLCRIVGGEVNLTDEADEIEYFKLEDIPNNTSPKQVSRIKDFFNQPYETVLKTQTGKSSLKLIEEGKL